MNCWKSVNMNKEYGQERRYFVSFLVGMFMFILLYVPFSIFHDKAFTNDDAFFPFLAIFIMMPTIHSLLHLVPCVLLGKQIRIVRRLKMKVFPVFYFCTKKHLSKPVSLITALSPTILFTLPGLVASTMYGDIYVYALMLTSVSIGLSVKDFIYTGHLLRAPRRSLIANRTCGIDILIEPELPQEQQVL